MNQKLETGFRIGSCKRDKQRIIFLARNLNNLGSLCIKS